MICHDYLFNVYKPILLSIKASKGETYHSAEVLSSIYDCITDLFYL